MQTTCKLQGAFRKKSSRIFTQHSLILLKDFEFCQVTCAVYLGMHVASPHSVGLQVTVFVTHLGPQFMEGT